MKCTYCGKEFPEPEDWDIRLWSASKRLSRLLQEVGIPLKLSPGNPLAYIDGMADCRNSPHFNWSHKEDKDEL